MSAMVGKRTLGSRAQHHGLRLPVRLIALDTVTGDFEPNVLEANGQREPLLGQLHFFRIKFIKA